MNENTQDNIYTGEEARTKLMAGIKKSAEAVGSTMGTGGANAIIEALESPGHLMTNDGFTILQSIKLADPVEDMGRKILMEAVSRANKQSGDGSSTTSVLTSAIIKAGNNIESFSHMEIKRSLEECIPIIQEKLAKSTKEVLPKDVGVVASISAEDTQIGETIQDIYKKIGKDGVIHWDVSKTPEDTYTIGKGITVEGAGCMSPYMCDLDEKTGQPTNVVDWKKPHILIVKQKINSAQDFNDLFEEMHTDGIKQVIVFCDEVEATVIPSLVMARSMAGFRAVLVKMPTLWKDEWYEDLSLASGATIVSEETGTSLKNMNPEVLGSFDHIKITKEDTFIDGTKDLKTHIKNLKEQGTEQSLYRASRLNTKTARYFVGAYTDSALSYRRLKVEDAINAGWQALHGGVVAGGGVALRDIAEELPDTVGGNILKEALKAPYNQILTNAGVGEQELEKGIGVDTRTGKSINMFEAGIVDPANIVFNACKNAISVGGQVLTSNTITTLPKEQS